MTQTELLNWSEKNLVKTVSEKVEKQLKTFYNPEVYPYKDAYWWAGFYIAG